MVKLQNLLVNSVRGYQGKYYPVANDCATVFPMLEMARERIWFNHHIIYIFNTTNPISAHNAQYTLQESCAAEIRSSPIYRRLHQPLLYRLESFETSTTDCIIISSTPKHLQTMLASIEYFLHDVNSVTVLYQPKTGDDRHAYQNLEHEYKEISFFDISSNALSQHLNNLPSDYIFFLHDTSALNAHIYCKEWIMHLERTFAHACYGALTRLDFEKNKIPYQHIENNLYAWKFLCDKKKIINPNNFGLSLYRKQDVITTLTKKRCSSLQDMLKFWASTKVAPQKIGLFFDISPERNNK